MEILWYGSVELSARCSWCMCFSFSAIFLIFCWIITLIVSMFAEFLKSKLLTNGSAPVIVYCDYRMYFRFFSGVFHRVFDMLDVQAAAAYVDRVKCVRYMLYTYGIPFTANTSFPGNISTFLDFVMV